MSKIAVRHVVVILAWLVLLAPPAVAQTTTSTIEGTVTDASVRSSRVRRSRCRSHTVAARAACHHRPGRGVSPDGAAGRYLTSPITPRASPPVPPARGDAQSRRHLRRDPAGRRGAETIAVSTRRSIPSTSATGATITRAGVNELPVNGRTTSICCNVPRRGIHRQVDPTSDSGHPVLGERSGNKQFPIDGQVQQGHRQRRPAQQFNQNHRRFQVLTSGTKPSSAGLGPSSMSFTKSGSTLSTAFGSLFGRNDALDTSNRWTRRNEPLPLRRTSEPGDWRPAG